jgi:predicted nucleotidyltransferase
MSRTALDLSPQELKVYDPGGAILRRTSAERLELTRIRRKALHTARQAARLLRTEFGAQKVVLFGSLAQSGHFTRWSDIDLAAWGIPSERFYAAVAAVTGLSAAFQIDLVDPEYCHKTLRTFITQEGKEL